MRPSNYLYALVRAYDNNTQPVGTIEEFRQQSRDFAEQIMPYAQAVGDDLFGHESRGDCTLQCRYDALVSIAYDMGLDLFYATKLPEMVRQHACNKHIKQAILATPSFNDTLRDDLLQQLSLYRLEALPRRMVEYKLYCGEPLFTIGRTKQNGQIVFAPSVLHPVYTFLTALANKR